MDENSHRDNIKDAMRHCLEVIGIENELDEDVYVFADAVFEALGITEDEQDNIGGYFMLHAGKREKKFVPPKPRDDDGCLIEEFEDEAENEYTKRTEELNSGAKYTSSEFKGYSVGNKSGFNGNWYIHLHTPICRYGQGYCKDLTMEEAKSRFVEFYYPIYLDDYERSKDIDKVDK